MRQLVACVVKLIAALAVSVVWATAAEARAPATSRCLRWDAKNPGALSFMDLQNGTLRAHRVIDAMVPDKGGETDGVY